MNVKKINKWGIFLFISLLSLSLTACSEEEDSRPYQDVQVVGVKVDGQLYLPNYGTNEATVVLPAGKNLSKVKTMILVANGDLLDFSNGDYHNCEKPFDLKLQSFNGGIIDYKLRVQSPPKLTNLIIEGLIIPNEDIHISENKIVVQVPKETILSGLKVTMTFVNGELQNFVNGESYDYNKTRPFQLLGVDKETVYPYELMITTEQVGPASIKGMSINGIKCDSVITDDKNITTAYIPSLVDFTNASVDLECGFGNIVDENAKLTALNLLTGTNKVKVTGTNGSVTEFTINVPKLSITPYLEKTYSTFGFGSDALSSFAFCGEYFAVCNHNTKDATAVPVGPNYYKLDGTYVGPLSKEDSNIDGSAVLGIRKLAADSKGVVLGVQLGAGAGASTELKIWKWNTVSNKPEVYITYTQTSLGLAYAPRAAGINIQGALDGDAIITIPVAQKTDVLVWEVKSGVLNPIPKKLAYPISGVGYYYAVEPLPLSKEGFAGASTSNSFSGIISLTALMGENHKISGITTTDCSTIEHNGRIYLAYTAFVAGKGARHRVCDITSGSIESYQNPIMDILMPSNQGNGNNTLDSHFMVRNGKLNAGFVCSNIGLRLYELEK